MRESVESSVATRRIVRASPTLPSISAPSGAAASTFATGGNMREVRIRRARAECWSIQKQSEP
jgi:hypothetical protein